MKFLRLAFVIGTTVLTSCTGITSSNIKIEPTSSQITVSASPNPNASVYSGATTSSIITSSASPVQTASPSSSPVQTQSTINIQTPSVSQNSNSSISAISTSQNNSSETIPSTSTTQSNNSVSGSSSSNNSNTTSSPNPTSTPSIFISSSPSPTSTPTIISSSLPTPTPTAVPTSTPSTVSENTGLNISNIENLIWEKTNQERQKAGLKSLGYENKIAEIARAFSKNMAENNFFSHTDLEGLSSSDRITKGYPELFTVGTAENIAYNFGKSDEEAATNLITAWMNSAGHRANILKSDLTYIGVGVYLKGTRIYATQDFIKPVATPVSDLSAPVNYGDTVNLTFKFFDGVIDKNNLTVFVKFPDSTAKFLLPDNSFFTGQGKYIPQWQSDNFTFALACDKGKGDYLIRICENNSCYDSKYKITVK